MCGHTQEFCGSTSDGHPMPTGTRIIPLDVLFNCVFAVFDVFAFHGALRSLCGLDHTLFGQDRQKLCQTYMFVPGTGFLKII